MKLVPNIHTLTSRLEFSLTYSYTLKDAFSSCYIDHPPPHPPIGIYVEPPPPNPPRSFGLGKFPLLMSSTSSLLRVFEDLLSFTMERKKMSRRLMMSEIVQYILEGNFFMLSILNILLLVSWMKYKLTGVIIIYIDYIIILSPRQLFVNWEIFSILTF